MEATEVTEQTEVKPKLVAKFLPKRGHKLWEYNIETEIVSVVVPVEKDGRMTSTYNKNYVYHSALNMKNAKKHFDNMKERARVTQEKNESIAKQLTDEKLT